MAPSLAPLILSLVLLSATRSTLADDTTTLRCHVCRALVFEFEEAVSKLNPKTMVEVGNYRLDDMGGMHQTKVPISKSQVHLSDMLDTMCKTLSDYARVRYKATKKLSVLKFFMDGAMNPEVSFVDFVQDEDLNKSLEYWCEGIIGDSEDTLIDIYSKRPGDELPDGKQLFCADHMKLCEDWMLVTDEDRKRDPTARPPENDFGFDAMNQQNPYDMEDDEGDLQVQRVEL